MLICLSGVDMDEIGIDMPHHSSTTTSISRSYFPIRELGFGISVLAYTLTGTIVGR